MWIQRWMASGILGSVSSLVAASMVSAAINPDEFRKGHSECLVVTFTQCDTSLSSVGTHVWATAEVGEVFWSDSGLRVGDTIYVGFLQDHARVAREEAEWKREPRCGPQILTFPEVPSRGFRALVHLDVRNADAAIYTPGAYQYSFDEVDAEGRLVYSRGRLTPSDVYGDRTRWTRPGKQQQTVLKFRGGHVARCGNESILDPD